MKQPTVLSFDLHNDVIAFSTTRHGGFSVGNYAEFNINPYYGDDTDAVRRNQQLMCQMLGIDDNRIIMPHQVHSTEMAQIDTAFFQCSVRERQQRLEGIDALMTNLPGVCIGVSTADCIPILIYDSRQHVVSAIHAGWRGTVRRIAQKSIAEMQKAFQSQTQDMIIQIGPGICLDSFEVGDEVYEAFAEAGFDMKAISQRQEKWHIDLQECNRLQLIAAGVPPTNIAVSDICTVKQSSEFFSARRLGIHSGRIFTGIMLK